MSTARASALALGSALAVLALFFLPVLTGDGVFLSGDTGQLHLGLKTWIGEELRRGHLPEWNPYLGLGAPVTAGAIDALFHPFTLLLLVLPPLAALQAWVLLSYALAAVGGFLWARRLGAGPAAAALGALAFSLSGFLVSSSANLTFLTALASLPLLLAAVHAFVEAPGPGRLALTCLAAWGAASAGDPQSFGLVLVGLPAYGALVVQDGTPPLRRGLLGLAAAAAAAVAAAPALWPVAAWVPHSSRGELLDVREVFRWNLPPLRLLELGIPGLFGGEPGVMMSRTYRAFGGDPVSQHPWVASVHLGASALALAALAASRRRSARALLAVAALTLWMAMGPAAGFTQLFGWLPVLGRFRYWEKLAFFPALLVAGAAAVGAQLLLAREAQPTRAARWFALAALLLLAGAGACWLAPGWVTTPLSSTPERLAAAPYLMLAAREGLVAAAVSLLALAGVALLAGGDRLRRAVPALLVAVVALELFGSSSRAWIASAPAAVEPTTPLVEHQKNKAPVLALRAGGGRGLGALRATGTEPGGGGAPVDGAEPAAGRQRPVAHRELPELPGARAGPRQPVRATHRGRPPPAHRRALGGGARRGGGRSVRGRAVRPPATVPRRGRGCRVRAHPGRGPSSPPRLPGPRAEVGRSARGDGVRPGRGPLGPGLGGRGARPRDLRPSGGPGDAGRR